MGRAVSGVIVETRERTDEETIGVRKMERPGRLGDGTPKKMTRTPWVSADEDDSGEAAVLLINSSRLITEEVVSQGIRIKAVIDTGAVVLVASPSLQEKLGARRMGWDGPSVVMVNGQRAPPLGALELEIEHRGMKASGKGVTAGKVLVSSDQPLGQVLMVNLTNRRAYLREGTVLGQMEALEPSIVAVDEGGTPDSLGDYVGEDSAESISDLYATPRVTSIPRQAFRAQVA
ncbi:hypothetical protein OUZ56_017185 [Daphnia magna]|uniref:Peptidase A2 domain-containing protein n=1 Tax=Daphnia magna TaxID=35525 RepID=A0ABR0ASC8_9CRUS|nr:hypothetical protein OUZ56_017185 [Daphnia magna]